MKKLSVLLPLAVLPFVTVFALHIIDFGGVSLDGAGALVLSYCIFFALSCLIYAITQRVYLSWCITAVPGVFLSMVNYYKLKINDTPFTLRDFSFGDNMGEVMGFALPQISVVSLMMAFLLPAGLTILLVLAEKYYTKTRAARLSALVSGCLVIIILAVPPVSAGISSLLGNHGLAPEKIMAENGVVSGLYCTGAESLGKSSYGADKTLMENIESSRSTSSVPEVKPTVIFIMSESFFDVTRLDNVTYSRDPLPNFHALQKEHSSGRFVSSTFCGGTGYVEMEFLTGLCSAFLKGWDDLTLLSEAAYASMPCITDVFESNGYTTEFIHSYNDELYNRPAIYEALGFDEIRFSDSFPADAEYSGGYISDMALTREIISAYEAKGSRELMLYAISMENHQPYSAEKYAHTDIEAAGDALTYEGNQVLEAYLQGVHNADRALGSLTDYFANTEEPVVIVFWGDHLPNLNLSDGTSVYERLGYIGSGNTSTFEPGELMRVLQTDYIIWDNFGLEKDNRTIGSSMLGTEVMTGINLRLTDYFSWLNKYIKDSYVMYRSGLFAPDDRNFYDKIPEAYSDMMKDYETAVIDIAYGNNTFFDKYRGEQRESSE